MTKPYAGVNRIARAWTAEEDDILREFAEKLLPWSYITDLNLLPSRTVSACQTRWNLHVRTKNSLKPNPRGDHLNTDRHHYDDRSAGGDPIGGGFYIFRVPDGDPYLQRLIQVHGNDNINRDITLIRTKSA